MYVNSKTHFSEEFFHLTENAFPENIFRRFFLIENVVHSDSKTIYLGTHFLKIPQQEINNEKFYKKL